MPFKWIMVDIKVLRYLDSTGIFYDLSLLSFKSSTYCTPKIIIFQLKLLNKVLLIIFKKNR